MRDTKLCLSFCVFVVLFCGVLLSAGSREPVVTTVRFKANDAPEVEPRVLCRGGQNFGITFGLVADGVKKGSDAYYFFSGDASYGRMSGTKTPFMSQLDLDTGVIRNFFPTQPVKLIQKASSDLLLGDDDDDTQSEKAASIKANWAWGDPVCGARGKSGILFLGTVVSDPSGREKDYFILKYDPLNDTFEQYKQLPSKPIALEYSKGVLWILLADTEICFIDDMSLDGGVSLERLGPLEKVDRNHLADLSVQGFTSDQSGNLYVAFKNGDSSSVLTFRYEKGRLSKTRLIKDLTIESATIEQDTNGIWCRLLVEMNKKSTVAFYRLQGGKASKMDAPPKRGAMITRNGNRVTLLLDQIPPSVEIAYKDSRTKRFPLVLEGVPYDNIKCLMADPKGKYLYGSGWPVCYIWRYDPVTKVMTRLGKHYVIYEMHPWNDEIWMIGYFGIKLLRWDPEKPWTFDYSKHYFKKTYPGNTSPWGDKDVSNPRLVCKFRYLKKSSCRRPAGMTIAGDGRVYAGGRTPSVKYFKTYYSGALSWYDPKTETIGQIRKPFVHHTVKDTCSADNGRYVISVASGYVCPYVPLPENYSPGKMIVYDTVTKTILKDLSPTGVPMVYAEEGHPGRVVIAGLPGKYKGEGIGGVMMVYDTSEQRITNIVRTPFRVVFAEYNVLDFKRGPDNNVYFYGRDNTGTAMYRMDSRTAKIEPVLRGHNITDVATYNNRGAAFAFMGDQVYFGCKYLVSVPLAKVIGGK